MLVGAPALAGCQTTKEAPNLATLSLSFAFQKPHACSRLSPEYTVGNVPAETKFLKLRMVDLDLPTYAHGGGTVAYSGGGKIPEGSLKQYEGPCPPTAHRYEVTVEALNADQTLVLGRGKATEKYPN